MIEYIFVLLIISILLFIVLRYKYIDYRKRRKLQKQFKRSIKLEKEAQYFLEKKGYKLLEEQYEHYHHYKVNGEDYKSKLIIDYVVSRKGKTYLVEVKSGKKAISISNKNTRRQILEYYFAIENDGVFLLDMENEELLKIEFASKSNEKLRSNYLFIIIIMLIILIIVVVLQGIGSFFN